MIIFISDVVNLSIKVDCGDKYMNNEILLSNIRELCKKNNITVAYLEKMMGMGSGTISRWNKANPSFDKVVSIARYFNVSIDYLSGYTTNSSTSAKLDENTVQIIDYLSQMTVKAEGNNSFWHDCKKNQEIALMVSDLPCMKMDKDDMSRLFYAYDDIGYYLLEVVYLMNDRYDYETQIRLYLVPDEYTIPVMECSDKSVLQALYITAVNCLEVLEAQKTAREKAKCQREKILEKYNN